MTRQCVARATDCIYVGSQQSRPPPLTLADVHVVFCEDALVCVNDAYARPDRDMAILAFEVDILARAAAAFKLCWIHSGSTVEAESIERD